MQKLLEKWSVAVITSPLNATTAHLFFRCTRMGFTSAARFAWINKLSFRLPGNSKIFQPAF